MLVLTNSVSLSDVLHRGFCSYKSANTDISEGKTLDICQSLAIFG